MSVSITPSSASNKVLVNYSLVVFLNMLFIMLCVYLEIVIVQFLLEMKTQVPQVRIELLLEAMIQVM